MRNSVIEPVFVVLSTWYSALRASNVEQHAYRRLVSGKHQNRAA